MIRMLLRIFDHIYIRTFTDATVSGFYRKRFGVEIGEGCRIMDRRLNLFGSEPYLITLGERVTIAEDVMLITHDGGVGLFRDEYPGLNVFGRIRVGDGCFIGARSILMPGITVGSNCVIGAGAIVTKDVPEGVVVAGVPAKVLCTIDEYKQKALNKGVMVTTLEPNRRCEEILIAMDEHRSV